MHFAHPHALWLLLFLPLLAAYEVLWGPRAKARLRFSSFRLMGSAPRKGPRRLPAVLRLAAAALVIVALARPQKGQRREEVVSPATDILLCVDTSESMRALDFRPRNRLGAAKDVIREFIKHRTRDRIGLVVFAGLPFTQCPLTLDHGALLGFLDSVRIGMVQEDGTAVGDAIATSVTRLKNSAAKSKVIILLTDGRSNRGVVDPLTAAQAAAALGIKIYTVGAGRPGQSLMPAQDPLFGERLVPVASDLDEETLRRIAEATKALYFRATSFEKLKDIYAEIDRMEKTDVKVETYADYRDAYPPFLLLSLLLFAAETLLAQTVFRRFP